MQSRIFSIITPVFSDNFAASYFVWKECYSWFLDKYSFMNKKLGSTRIKWVVPQRSENTEIRIYTEKSHPWLRVL